MKKRGRRSVLSARRWHRVSEQMCTHPGCSAEFGSLRETEREIQWSRDLEFQWTTLHQLCSDRASRARLTHLIRRLSSNDYGGVESALAELDLAFLLIRAGLRVGFLPESRSRTADLECWHGRERFFVEVTAMVGGIERRKTPQLHSPPVAGQDQDGEERGHILIGRIIARISQKARQLVDYCEPVLLAITVPSKERLERRYNRGRRPYPSGIEELDVMQLAGAVTAILPRVRQVSAVLLSLWDVKTARARSGIRLANVHLVQRSPQQTAYPRVRLLILNPSAGYPLKALEIALLKGLL